MAIHACDSVVGQTVQRLVAALSPERIYLFGSQTRGETGPDSDYDLLVVVRTSTLPWYRRNQAAFEVLLGVGATKDVLVLTHDKFERQRQVVCSLPATVEREGVLLYAA
jgi:predicted nucleotidyltransferase